MSVMNEFGNYTKQYDCSACILVISYSKIYYNMKSLGPGSECQNIEKNYCPTQNEWVKLISKDKKDVSYSFL